MDGKMECHISDGPQTPDEIDPFELEDEDEAYERHRQEQIDDAAARAQSRIRTEELLK